MQNAAENKNFAGLRRVNVLDNHLGVTFPMFILYPTDTPEKEESIGPYRLNVSIDAHLQDKAYPLAVISHGTGGSPLVYRNLARNLAKNGFIAAMPEHPYNNIHDNHLENSIKLLESRPKNITQAIDWFYHDPLFKAHVNFDEISLIGHSMGGYTAIAAAGGIPAALPWETDNQIPKVIDLEVEERIKKVILLAPALGWFRNEGALKNVDLSILMMTGEKDEITPSFHAEFLLKGMKDSKKVVHKVIKNAGHFSFLSPFPETMKKASFPPSQDPEGFNREAFHQELEAEVLNFLIG